MKSLLFLVATSLLVLVSCSKESKNNGSAVQCPAGTVYNGTYCVNANQTPNIVQQNTNVVFSATYKYPYMNDTMSVGGGMQNFLENVMGTCNRYHSNNGMADCGGWAGGMTYLVISANSSVANTVTISIGASPAYNMNGYNYYSQLPSFRELLFGVPIDSYMGAMFNPLIISGFISPYNNSQGFVIEADGPQNTAGFNGKLYITVTNGKLEDRQFSFAATFEYHNFGNNANYNLNLMNGTMYRR